MIVVYVLLFWLLNGRVSRAVRRRSAGHRGASGIRHRSDEQPAAVEIHQFDANLARPLSRRVGESRHGRLIARRDSMPLVTAMSQFVMMLAGIGTVTLGALEVIDGVRCPSAPLIATMILVWAQPRAAATRLYLAAAACPGARRHPSNRRHHAVAAGARPRRPSSRWRLRSPAMFSSRALPFRYTPDADPVLWKHRFPRAGRRNDRTGWPQRLRQIDDRETADGACTGRKAAR